VWNDLSPLSVRAIWAKSVRRNEEKLISDR
jgi:hypothetical protein